jgi:F0F1-type ATP synthase assembly protein I
MQNQPGAHGESAEGQHAIAWSIASIMTQVGCVTFFFTMAAVVVGLWLDSQFGTRPLFTVVFFLVSVPIVFYIVIRLVLRNADRLQAAADARQADLAQQEAGVGGSGNGNPREQA